MKRKPIVKPFKPILLESEKLKTDEKVLDECSTNRQRWTSTEWDWMWAHAGLQDIHKANDFMRFCFHFTVKSLTLQSFLNMPFQEFAQLFPLDQDK